MAETLTLNIGEAARRSGVSAKMVRHYESLGLLPPVHRTESGYRQYGDREVHTLRFIRRARDLGFSMKQIQTLLGLWQQHRPSREVKRLALEHVRELEGKIRELEAMKRTLETLAENCHGNERPDCPILEDLADDHEHHDHH